MHFIDWSSVPNYFIHGSFFSFYTEHLSSLRELKDMKAICEKQTRQIQELKGGNEIRAKQIEKNSKDLDNLKVLAEILKNKVETIKTTKNKILKYKTWKVK